MRGTHGHFNVAALARSQNRIVLFSQAHTEAARRASPKREHKVSLGTKDLKEAKTRHAKAHAELVERWANLLAGPKPMTERELHAVAGEVHDAWLHRHHDNPSLQRSWDPKVYATLWSDPRPFRLQLPPCASSMRIMCFDAADQLTAKHGLVMDDLTRIKLEVVVAAAFQRASLQLARQGQGDFHPEELPQRVQLNRSEPSVHIGSGQALAGMAGDRAANCTITQILEDWWRESQKSGLKRSTYESYRSTVKNLIAFLGHDVAWRVTPADVAAFKDHRLSTASPRTGKVPSAKTVKDSDLSALKSLFAWAVANHKASNNPASGITIKLRKPMRLRSKGFTDAEVKVILTAAYRHTNSNERPGTAAAKRWVPWLCAFTGARVGEMAQLRRQDIQHRDDTWLIRITPEAGTQKTNEAREVPLHQQLIELGFTTFVQSCPEGPLCNYPRPCHARRSLIPLANEPIRS